MKTPAGERMVFIVDDDQAVRDSYKALLESGGWTVRAFASAEELLEVPTGDRNGCLIVDVRMAGLSGLKLLEILARGRLDLPAVVITAHKSAVLETRAKALGARAVLEKPVSPRLLFEALSRLSR